MGATRILATGHWAYRFVLKGKLYKKEGYESKRQALEAEWALRKELIHRPSTDCPETFRELVDRYLAAVQPPILAPLTHVNYTSTLAMMTKEWGSLHPSKVTTEHIEGWRQQRIQKGRMPGTINRELATVCKLYNWAIRAPRLWVHMNPASQDRLPRPKLPWRMHDIVTPEELAHILNVLGRPDYIALTRLLYIMGVRLRVVSNLRWEQVDLKNGIIQYRSKGKDKVRALDTEAQEVLSTLGPQRTGPVFPNLALWDWRNRWNKARVQLGKPRLRPHDLRVTFAREHASAGTDLDTIREMLGHSSFTMTQRYIPFSLDAQKRAGERRQIIPFAVTPAP